MDYFHNCSECMHFDEDSVAKTFFGGVQHYCNRCFSYVNATSYACDDFFISIVRDYKTINELNEEDRKGIIRDKNKDNICYGEEYYKKKNKEDFQRYINNIKNNNIVLGGYLKKYSPYFYTILKNGKLLDRYDIYNKLDAFRSLDVPNYSYLSDIVTYDNLYGNKLNNDLINKSKDNHRILINMIILMEEKVPDVYKYDLDAMHELWNDLLYSLEDRIGVNYSKVLKRR